MYNHPFLRLCFVKILPGLFLVLLPASNISAQKHPSAARPAQPDNLVGGTPVVFNDDTLFTLYTGRGSFSVIERTRAIENRLQAIAALPELSADSFRLVHDSLADRLYYGEQILLLVDENDAKFSDLDRNSLAKNYLRIIQEQLILYKQNTSIKSLLIRITEVVVVLLFLLLLIGGINRLFRWIRYQLLTDYEKKLKDISIKGYKLITAQRLQNMGVNTLRILRLIIILLLIYLSLPLLFGIFPWSKPIAEKLIYYTVTPVKTMIFAFIHYLPNLLTIIVLYFITHYLIRLVRFLAQEVAAGTLAIRNFHPELAIPTFQIIRALLYLFMFIIMFPYLPGSDSNVFKGVTVFIGLLLSFGSSSAVSNMVAGIVLTYMRSFRVGDRVKIGEVYGDVVEKTLLLTRIRTIKNEDITVPNSTILTGHAINYSARAKTEGIIIHTTVSIGYDAPWRQVHELLIRAAKSTPHVLPNPEPFVLQQQLNDFYVSYEINAYTDQPSLIIQIYSELHQHIQDQFNEAGVEIMSPHYSSLRDGNTIAIPKQYRPKEYKAPGFRMNSE